MTNKVTFQYRKFYDLDSYGNETGEPMLGYCIFDNYNEVVNVSFIDNDDWKNFLAKTPQELLEYIRAFYDDTFTDSILDNGFYINHKWYSVDDLGKVIK